MNQYKAVEAMLYSYKSYKTFINNIDIEIRMISNNYNECAAISYDEKTGCTNKFNSVVENEVISKEKQIAHLKQIKEQKTLQMLKITNALEILNERDYEIIKLKYFYGISNQAIAAKLNLTEQWVCDVKSKIIKKLVPLIFVT